MVNFVCKIGAKAGEGVMVTGRMMCKIFSRGGFYVVGYPEYPSLIRGGHNTFQVHVGDSNIYCQRDSNDLVIAFNKAAIFFHKDFISENGAIIYDEKIDLKDQEIRKDIKLYPIPLQKILEDLNAPLKMKNTILVGATLALIEYPFEKLEGVLKDEFSRKGEEIVKKNIEVAKSGYNYMSKNFDISGFRVTLKPVSDKRRMMLTGNEAIALGSLKGGLKFYSAYPMTPATSVLHYLAAKEREADIVIKHTEDEISAINYAVGAAFAGTRAMTGTSGGGFALMTETLGMAALAETPLVVFLSQRVGPSTGMPTWSEQADLKFALNASQGDFMRVVLAPGDIEESFYLSADALNIAEKYQLPVLILNDKFLAESSFAVSRFDESGMGIDRGKIAENPPKLKKMQRFKRYKVTKDGVSPRTFPGQPNGMHVATSYVHDETGFSSEGFQNRVDMVAKRNKKLKNLLKDLPGPKFYGPENADITLVAWGSQKLPALASLEVLEKEGIKANLLHFSYLFPLDQKKVKQAFKRCRKTLMLENNSTGQFAGILREYTGVKPNFMFLRFDGRPFFVGNIVDHVKKLKEKGYKGLKMAVFRETVNHEYYYPAKFGV